MTDIALKVEEEMLFLDVSDAALELAAGAEVHSRFTLGACTGLSECPG